MDCAFVPFVRSAVVRDCQSGWGGYSRSLDSHNIMFAVSGGFDIAVDGVRERIRAGNVTYCPLGAERELGGAEEGTRIYAFDFMLYGADGPLPLPTVSDRAEFDEFTHLFKDFFFAWYQKNDGYELYCSGVFAQILYYLLAPQGTRVPNRHVRRIKEYIIDHLDERITVEGVARAVNLSPVYCGAMFARSEGVTIHEFVNKTRINRACDILLADSLSIKEIAEATGYSDVFHFSKVFKRIMGVSPSEYRHMRVEQTPPGGNLIREMTDENKNSAFHD